MQVPSKLAKEWLTYVPAALERLGLPGTLSEDQLNVFLEQHAHIEHQVL